MRSNDIISNTAPNPSAVAPSSASSQLAPAAVSAARNGGGEPTKEPTTTASWGDHSGGEPTTTTSSSTPLGGRKAVYLRVKRGRSVAALSNTSVEGSNASGGALSSLRAADARRENRRDRSDDNENDPTAPSASPSSTTDDRIQVRIGGKTYNFTKMTEARRMVSNAAAEGEAKSKKDAVEEEVAADVTEVSPASTPAAALKAEASTATEEGETTSATTTSQSTTAAEKGEAKEEEPTAAALNPATSTTTTTTTAPKKDINTLSHNHKGAKQALPSDNAKVKERSLAKLGTEAVNRRRVLRLSNIECCRLGLALGSDVGGMRNKKDSNDGGNNDEMGVLISAVEFSAGISSANKKKQGSSASATTTTTPANRKALLNAANTSAATKNKGIIGGASASATTPLSINGKPVRKEDAATVRAAQQTDEILNDLYEHVMHAERQAMKGGRTLRDDELDIIIANFHKSAAEEKAQKQRRLEEEAAAARAKAEEEERRKQMEAEAVAEEDDDDDEGEYDYYMLEVEDGSAHDNFATYGDGGYENGEEDAYDLVGGADEDADDAAHDDDDAATNPAHGVAFDNPAAASTTDGAVYHDGEEYPDAGDDEPHVPTTNHLEYDFNALTIQPHIEHQKQVWRQQPMDVAISHTTSTANISNPPNTTDDDFDFTEMRRGPQNTYSLQAPTIRNAKNTPLPPSLVANNSNKHVRFSTTTTHHNASNNKNRYKSLLSVAAGHMRDVVNGTNLQPLFADKARAMPPTKASTAAYDYSPHHKHADPLASINTATALNAYLDEQQFDEQNAFVADNNDDDDAVARSFFGPLLGKWNANGTAVEWQNNGGKNKKKGSSAASGGANSKALLPSLPTSTAHMRNNLGAEDPEIVFQHDDEYDSNDENHYGNDYADESDGSSDSEDDEGDDDGGCGPRRRCAPRNDEDDESDDDHDDNRVGMGFNSGPRTVRLGAPKSRALKMALAGARMCNNNGGGGCPIGGDDDEEESWGSDAGGGEDDDDEDDDFQGYDRYGDLGYKHVDYDKTNYADDSSEEDYYGVGGRRGLKVADEDDGFDDYGRLAHDEADDDDNYN